MVRRRISAVCWSKRQIVQKFGIHIRENLFQGVTVWLLMGPHPFWSQNLRITVMFVPKTIQNPGCSVVLLFFHPGLQFPLFSPAAGWPLLEGAKRKATCCAVTWTWVIGLQAMPCTFFMRIVGGGCLSWVRYTKIEKSHPTYGSFPQNWYPDIS